jgi:hypothetical protein
VFKNSKSIALALTLAGSLAVSGAQAASASFDFYKNGGGLGDSSSTLLSFTSNGVGVTITPVSTSDSAKVTYRWDGIGVSTGFLEAGELNSSLLHSPGDALLLSFSEAVTLDKIAFSQWENGLFGALDKATITTGGQTYALSNALNDNGLLVKTFSLGSVIPAGQFFLLQATGDVSAFRLAGLNVTTVAAVPEANTVAMFGLGLLGVAAVARRRIKG